MKYACFVSEDISLGLGYVITYLKEQGHEVELFFDPRQFSRGYARNNFLAKVFSTQGWLIRKVKKYNPDVCMFTCVTATYQWALTMAKKVKRTTGCKIIFGGVHTTLVPEEVIKHDFIDEIVKGDGIEHFGGKFDADKYWPEREMFLKELPPEHRKVQLFMTSFGCPYNCSFCGNEQLRKVGKFKIKRRSREGCISELKDLKDKGMKYVLFVDDIFTCDRSWLLNFLPMYSRDIGLPFACFIHPKMIDEKIAKALKEAGCHTAWMGIQTGNEELRKNILNRHETNDEIIKAAKSIKDNDIKLMVDHIFGIPYENNGTQDISYVLYREIKPDIVNCYELLYFPKAKIIEHALKVGYLKKKDIKNINEGKGVTYQVGNSGNYFYDTYSKAMCAIPLGGIEYELLPLTLIKLIAHIKAGRGFMPIAVIQNELYFTWKAILKRMRLI